MLNIILGILSLMGSIGIFLFGMKIMSESLQKVAGSRLRNILTTITANKFRSVLTGFTITAIIQSSSASTVMIVSFVNAGLLSLTESIGIIMGANIGTTITAWLIAILGFNFPISTIAVPLIGLGFPLIFSSVSTRKYWGEFIFGFALIFLGLEFLKGTIPDLKTYPGIMEFFSNFNNLGFLSVLIFVFIGMVFTMIIQSSSAAMAFTLVMCYKGWIGFDLAAAMIMGENIGTTITANIAAIVGNPMAKRAALAHFVFNFIGVSWMVFLLKFFLFGIDKMVLALYDESPYLNVALLPVALSLFHSIFNVSNSLILIWFIPYIKKITYGIIPSRKKKHEKSSLQHISTGLLSTSELSIFQARKEIAFYGKRIHKMFKMVRELFMEVNLQKFDQLYDRIVKYEEKSDAIELEIANYLTKLSEEELSQTGTIRVRTMLKLIDEIESVGDSCYNMSRTIQRKKENKIWFTQELRNNLNAMFDLIEEAFEEMIQNLQKDYMMVNANKAYGIEMKINKMRNMLKENHLESIESGNYKYNAGVIYSDLIAQNERLGDFIINVSQAISEGNRKTS